MSGERLLPGPPRLIIAHILINSYATLATREPNYSVIRPMLGMRLR